MCFCFQIGCLALCWARVCGSLIKGIQSYGKVVYFTTLFPYIVLTIMVGYVATLDGFSEGMEFYFVPDWDRLGDVEVWNAAAGQIFFSLGVAVGSQLLLSSYNGFNANAHRDALFIALGNSATSMYAGVVVFGVVGFIAHEKGVEIPDVITAGKQKLIITLKIIILIRLSSCSTGRRSRIWTPDPWYN